MLIPYILWFITVVIFYRHSENKRFKDVCVFFATVLVVSTFALPLILARTPVSSPAVSILFSNNILKIKWGASGLTEVANGILLPTLFFAAYIACADDN